MGSGAAAYLLQRTELIQSVERLQVVAKHGDNVIKFDLVPKNQSLLVSAFAVGFGQGKELLACLQVLLMPSLLTSSVSSLTCSVSSQALRYFSCAFVCARTRRQRQHKLPWIVVVS
jgi:hypothetical protein